MKIIRKYEAIDGKEFNTEKECLIHEGLIFNLKEIMGGLKDIPDSCGFSNGEGYVQQDAQVFMNVRTKILTMAKQFNNHKFIQESIDKGLDVHPSYARRVIGDCCPNIIYTAWHRIMCTTNNFKEFGQPYYREHPSKATGGRLN